MKIFFTVVFIFTYHDSSFANGTGVNSVGLTLPCATCHGLPGENSNSMNLYGYDEKRFFKKFKSFQLQSGNGRGVMHFIAKGYSDSDIKLMATYFAENDK